MKEQSGTKETKMLTHINCSVIAPVEVILGRFGGKKRLARDEARGRGARSSKKVKKKPLRARSPPYATRTDRPQLGANSVRGTQPRGVQPPLGVRPFRGACSRMRAPAASAPELEGLCSPFVGIARRPRLVAWEQHHLLAQTDRCHLRPLIAFLSLPNSTDCERCKLSERAGRNWPKSSELYGCILHEYLIGRCII